MAKYLKDAAKYYDLTQGAKDFVKYSKFVGKILKRFNVEGVLELGCGTGLYLFPLKEMGFDVTGLDLSKDMLEVAKSKGKAKLFYGDMSKFNFDKKFDAVICMNSSLILLPNFKAIEKTFERVNKHLIPGGIFVLDIANLAVEIRDWNYTQENSSFKLDNGKLDLIRRDYKKWNKWISEWNGFVQEGNSYREFKESYVELIYSVKQLEKALKKNGFKILDMYGSRDGNQFKEGKSNRRFYVCQKIYS